MKMVEALLELAEELAGQCTEHEDKARRFVARRRAVSTAYYAVFHALMQLCAEELLGSSKQSGPEYEIVYRSLNHGSLKDAFNKKPLNTVPTLKEIGDRVVELQTARNLADYVPMGRFNKKRAADEKPAPPSLSSRKLVQSAKSAVQLLRSLAPNDRRTLAVYLVFKNRTS
jgi:uncharacterized protein (UPF0332 family)